MEEALPEKARVTMCGDLNAVSSIQSTGTLGPQWVALPGMARRWVAAGENISQKKDLHHFKLFCFLPVLPDKSPQLFLPQHLVPVAPLSLLGDGDGLSPSETAIQVSPSLCELPESWGFICIIKK